MRYMQWFDGSCRWIDDPIMRAYDPIIRAYDPESLGWWCDQLGDLNHS